MHFIKKIYRYIGTKINLSRWAVALKISHNQVGIDQCNSNNLNLKKKVIWFLIFVGQFNIIYYN